MDITRNKAAVWTLWEALDGDPMHAPIPADALWQGPEPVGRVAGGDIAERLFAPLSAAVAGLKRQVHIFCGGVSEAHETDQDGTHWVAGTGYYTGRGLGDLFGIPCAGHDIRLRWGEFLRFDAAGQVVQAQTIWDFADLSDLVGRPMLPKPRGEQHVYPAPTGYDGIVEGADPRETAETLAFGRQFIFGGLNAFDESDLSSMGMDQFFHPNIKWYGPGGIGACLSLTEFQERHQAPWLTAFPDRKVAHLDSLFADGRVLAASGPRGVLATHGGPYLGVGATGATLEVSGLDFWLRSGNVFTENWVFVDMPHLFAQMGVDLFARVQA
ncbi:MAG: hypothetical protein AAF092_01930 [Pseudomonadota bacterium]